MSQRKIRVTISGTGFAGGYTAAVYGMVPHKNGVEIDLAGVCSGRIENARGFAERHEIRNTYVTHQEMVLAEKPDIDNIACANYTHGRYAMESARAGVPVIVLEKPPVIWPGYEGGRLATAAERKSESMRYLAEVLDAVRSGGSKLLYAEDFIYVDGVIGIVRTIEQARAQKKGKILYQSGLCAHQGSHAPAYDTPSMSGGGALFNNACHPLGPVLYLKQIEGILLVGRPIRPSRVSAVARQVLKHQPESAGEHFRVMQNVEDFGRITVVFEDETIAEVIGHDLSISGIRNSLTVITDHSQYDVRINPNNANEVFLPRDEYAGRLLYREKLPTSAGTSFPSPRQFAAHGYVGEMNDAVECALDTDRAPQSGPMTAWDTMAVLMAAYESDEKNSQFIDVGDLIEGRQFEKEEWPDPSMLDSVFQSR